MAIGNKTAHNQVVGGFSPPVQHPAAGPPGRGSGTIEGQSVLPSTSDGASSRCIIE